MSATKPLREAVKAHVHSDAAPAPPATGDALTGIQVAAAATLAAVVALSATVAVFGLVLLITPQSETLESLWWLAGFGVATPLAALGAVWLLRAAQAPAARRTLEAAAPCALLSLCGTLALARALGTPPWSLLLPAIPLALVLSRPGRALIARAAGTSGRDYGVAAVALAGLLGAAAFLPGATFRAGEVILTLLLLALAVPIAVAVHKCPLHLRARLALGVLIPVLLALLAWDVSFQALPSHQDFYLGPVNDIRHGRYMLVDDYSQYGVGVIYFLAAIMAPLPFGYGTFVLAVGVLTAVLFAAIYVVLRVATRSLAFAALGTFTALMASSIATLGRSTEYPSTGFLRFGLPWLLVASLVVAYRRDRPARAPLLVAYALVGVACVWSFETAFYTVATFVVTGLAAAWTGPEGTRLRTGAVHLGAGAAAVVVAIAGLVAATLIGRGQAPDVGGYVDFLRLYSVEGFGQLPVPGWSLGYVMGALYVASLVGVWTLAVRLRGGELGRASVVVPLAAVSTLGAVSLSYFLGRSHPNNLTHVAPPFVVMATLWSALAWRAWIRDRNPIAACGLALAVACAALLGAQQLPQLTAKAPDSALAAVAHGATGGGPGLVASLDKLTDLPVISPRTRTVEALVRASVPRGAPLLVAVEPAVATETLVRLDRSGVLPIGTPEQDGLVPQRRQALLGQAEDIPCGAYVVTQEARMTGPGRVLLADLVTVLKRRHPFRAVAGAEGYRVFRLGCAPA